MADLAKKYLPLRLTRFGEIAYRYGAMTPPRWWLDRLAEFDRFLDVDEDWGVAAQERVEGLRALADALERYGMDGLAAVVVTEGSA